VGANSHIAGDCRPVAAKGEGQVDAEAFGMNNAGVVSGRAPRSISLPTGEGLLETRLEGKGFTTS
jgi:hypothetical protein